MGDGAEVVGRLLAGHPDAGVFDDQATALFVGGDLDVRLKLLALQLLVDQRLKASFVQRVGGVADQLAKEDSRLVYRELVTSLRTAATSALNSCCSGMACRARGLLGKALSWAYRWARAISRAKRRHMRRWRDGKSAAARSQPPAEPSPSPTRSDAPTQIPPW